MPYTRRGQPEWELLAVWAPLENVATFLGAHRGSETRSDEGGVFALQLQGQAWTLFPLAVGWLDRKATERLGTLPRELSQSLHADVVYTVSKDASAGLGYGLWRERVLIRDWVAESDATDSDPDAMLRAFFAAQGVAVPELGILTIEEEPHLVLHGLEPDAILALR